MRGFFIGLAVVVISTIITAAAINKVKKNVTGDKKSILNALLWSFITIVHALTALTITFRALGVPISSTVPLSLEPVYGGFVEGVSQWFMNLWSFARNRWM